jgi:phosphodiesterase/alkaline phosphatase D-like protein
MKRFFLFGLFFLSLVKSTKIHHFDEIKIAFGSCYGWRNKTSNIFQSVSENNPSVWLWVGDAAYTDRKFMPYSKINQIK